MNQSMIDSPLHVDLTHYSVSTDFGKHPGKRLSIADVMPVPRHLAVAPKLTNREIEVLRWSAEGLTASEVARQLHLSRETVHSHVKNAVIKLQVVNKTAAVAQALRLRLIN